MGNQEVGRMREIWKGAGRENLILLIQSSQGYYTRSSIFGTHILPDIMACMDLPFPFLDLLVFCTSHVLR